MKHLAQRVRRFDRQIVDYWSWPVKIGLAWATATTIAILYPPAEMSFTQASVFRLVDRPWQYAMAALLVALLILAVLLPYWGGVACTLVICPLRMIAYTNAFNLAVYAVYGAIMYATVAAAIQQYRLSRWVIAERARHDAKETG